MAWSVALATRMGAKNHRELLAWQLADELRRIFLEFTARPNVRRDYGFCEQTNRAARSACRNLAEGFRRSSHQDFARFVDIARGSLGELFDSVDEARHKRYIDDHQADTWNQLIERALKVTTGLHVYLTRTSDSAADARRRRRFGR